MPCQSATLSYIDARCDTSIGGIKRILIANADDVSGVTIASESNENKLITAVGLAEGKTFKQWRFRKNTGSYTSTLATDQAIGNSSVTTEVSLQFSHAEAEKRLAIQSAINANAVVIVEDMFGQYIYLGKDNEVVITSATMQSGTATSDLNGFNLTLQDIATELPYFVKPDIIPGLLSADANQPVGTVMRTITYEKGSANSVSALPASVQKADASVITLPTSVGDVTPENYDLSSWKSSKHNKYYAKGATYVVSGDDTLTAQYNIGDGLGS